jgi:tripartite-type tricarboxylate transporter receptor subunit TctC
MRRILFTLNLLAISSMTLVGPAFGQNYPNRPVRIVVPYPPGGGTDILARTLAQKLTELLGQPVVVDNRAGANGIIGTDQAAKAKPDGYTVLIAIATHAINPMLYAKLPYDTNTDLLPVSLLAEYPFVITVHPTVPAKTIREFIAFAKTHRNQLSYASSGVGSGPHLGMELFKTMTGIEMVHVPYKGSGAAMTDVVSGQVQVFLNNFLSGMPMIKSGKVRPLAVTSLKRSSAMPELPTVAESGVPGFAVTGWYGMLVPAGTPAPVLNTLHEAVVSAVKSKDIKDRLSGDAAEPVGSTPQEFADFLRIEIDKWASVIKKAGVRAETY